MWWSRLTRAARTAAQKRRRPPGGALTALRHAHAGFLPDEAILYDLASPRAADYLSSRQQMLSWPIDWPAAGLLDHKLAFYFMLRHLGVPTPEVSGVVVRGRAHELGPRGADTSLAWLRRRLDARGRLVIRPTRGSGGHGLRMLEHGEGGYVLNGRKLGWQEIEADLAELDDHLVTDFVEQAAAGREIFPGATNTIRLLTMPAADGQPFIAAALQRFGTPESAPADNWSRGGVGAGLDLQRGTLKRLVTRTPQGGIAWHDHHPATGVRVTGVPVPNWPALRDGILAAAGRMPFLPYVGWDVIPTDEGFSVIEGNKNPDLTLQVHGALLSDPRVRAFYSTHGVI